VHRTSPVEGKCSCSILEYALGKQFLGTSYAENEQAYAQWIDFTTIKV